MSRFPASQSGVTLLEVLIAVLVLSVGLLGMASLQFKGLRNGQQSYQHSQAALLAFELSDLMRTSHAQAVAGAFVVSATPPAPTVDCKSLPCTPAAMAAYDLSTWYSRVSTRLPNGSATIACNGACGEGVPQTVTIAWDHKVVDPADTDYVLSFVP